MLELKRARVAKEENTFYEVQKLNLIENTAAVD